MYSALVFFLSFCFLSLIIMRRITEDLVRNPPFPFAVMPRPPVEKLSKALRRQTQVHAWQRRMKKPNGLSHDTAAPSFTKNPEKMEISAQMSSPSSSSSASCEASGDGIYNKYSIIHANHSLRAAMARGAPETRITRQTAHAIRHSDGKTAAMKAFQVLLYADGEAPTAATFNTLASTLLQHHVEERIGSKALQTALTDATGAASSERWKGLSAAEHSVLINYLCRTTERWACRGSSFNKHLGFTQEGADNEIATQIEFQMRKSGALVSPSSLTDLVHLDISWTTALHLYKYCAELHTVPPPVEMTDRLMGLMTGYRTGGLGSRPWGRALELYEQAFASGYDLTLTTHTHALDALWRSADDFHRVHTVLSDEQKATMWAYVQCVRQRVADAQLHVAGEDGCAYVESLVKACASSGHWSDAVSLFSGLATSAAATTRRFLIPTAETFAFAIAACHAAGNASHGEALFALFRETYTLRSLHPEALLVLLQSLRHVVRVSPLPGQIVSELAAGEGADRAVAVACLQLLASSHCSVRAPRVSLAQKFLDMHDSSAWPQQPLARKAELQTIFRCCHLVAAMDSTASHGPRLIARLREKLTRVFGAASAEVEWLDDTAVYSLLVTSRWEEAIAIYDSVVRQRPPERVPYLPIPLRQAREMFLDALLRCCRAAEAEASGDSFFVEDDARETERQSAAGLAAKALGIAESLCGPDDAFPHRTCAELLLLQAGAAGTAKERKALALKAMRHLSMDSAGGIDRHIIGRVAEAMALTELHVESALVHGHAALRYATLTSQEDKSSKGDGPFEMAVW